MSINNFRASIEQGHQRFQWANWVTKIPQLQSDGSVRVGLCQSQSPTVGQSVKNWNCQPEARDEINFVNELRETLRKRLPAAGHPD
tara:strand:+ start:2031 stop:2288 length:258 start_codon:yes stop_codon:yes gene_type:complete